MPDRLQRTRVVGIIVISLLVVVTMMTAVTLAAVRGQSDAVNALRTSSARGECRTRVTNEDSDTFHHDLALLFRASRARNTAEMDRLIEKIRNAEPVQDHIDRVCPAPLVETNNSKESK